MHRSNENLKSRSFQLLPRRCVSISLVSSIVNANVSSANSSPSLSSRHCSCLSEKERESFSSVTTTSSTFECQCHQPTNVVGLFQTFIRENSSITSYTTSSGLLRKLDLLGVVYPSTLLVNGPTEAIEMVCLLWNKRLLKAPTGYIIRFIGKLTCSHITLSKQMCLVSSVSRTLDVLSISTISGSLICRVPLMNRTCLIVLPPSSTSS